MLLSLTVLILIVMDNGLSLEIALRYSSGEVLTLLVMDNGLSPTEAEDGNLP